MNVEVIAADLSKAPEAVREEIKKVMGSENGVRSFDDYQKLSAETKSWLSHQALHGNVMLVGMVKRKYKELGEFMDAAIDGLRAMERIMPKDEADTLNLDLYNACAKYVRAYNSLNMAGSNK